MAALTVVKNISRRIAALSAGTAAKPAPYLLGLCFFIVSCSGSPRYTKSSDSLDKYTPQHLERRITCCGAKDTTGTETSDRHKRTAALRKTGKASYYGTKFHGKKTASGAIYDQNELTAAHRTLPFGTVVAVTNLINRRTVTVRINDRGPHKRSRIIDVSYAAAQKLDMIEKGIVPVSIEVVSPP